MSVDVTRTEEGLHLSQLDLFFVELLRQVPVSAEPGDSTAARDRLYPGPSDDAQAQEDWRTYVHPDLKLLFTTGVETVREDLEKFEQIDETQEHWTFEIPAAHFEKWLNVLNQARLVIAARFNFQEDEMNQGGPRTIETARDLSLFQVHFYGFLQECMLQGVEG